MPITFYLWNIFSDIDMLISIYSIGLCFKRKYNSVVTVLPPLLFMLTLDIIVIINQGKPDFWIAPYAMFVLQLLYDIFMFKGKIGQKVFYFTLSYMLSMLSELCIILIMNNVNSITNLNRTDYNTLAFGVFIEMFITLFFTFILVTVFNRFIRKNEFQNFGNFIIFPISQTLMILGLLYGHKIHNDYIERFQFGNLNGYTEEIIAYISLVVLANLLAIVADVILYRINRENAQKKELEEQLQFLEHKDKLELEYYNLMQSNINETRKIRHDFYNILAAIDTNGSALGTELKQELTEKFQSTSTAPICDNHIANLVMQNKKKICEQNNINLQIDAEIPENLNITNFELLRVISNIFDNCIEATKNADGEKFIRIESAMRDNYFFLKAENPVGKMLSKDGENYATTKADKKSHGFGMKILSDIAKKYNGTFSAEDKDGKFYTNIILEIPKENA